MAVLALRMDWPQAADQSPLVRPVYIVLSTIGVGGAEKRFTDNWHQLVADFGMDVHLVMHAETHAALVSQSGYADKLLPTGSLHLLQFSGSYRAYCDAVIAFFATQPTGAIVHFPLAYVPGMRRSFGHRVLVSWVNSAMPPFSRHQWKLWLGAWIGFLGADHVDVLNPDNLRRIARVPGMSRKASLTAGGTQIDSALYKPATKRGDLVFLGRAEPEKQCLRFVQCLPDLHRLLGAAGHQGYRFLVCGDGREAQSIRDLLASDEYLDIPVEFGYTTRPEQVLASAEVYFSLQRTSNYPSKALAEAMACGAFPVMTRVGESELMVQGCHHYAFVPGSFGAADLFDAISGFLELDADARREVAVSNSVYATERFSPGKQALYYAKLYESLCSAG